MNAPEPIKSTAIISRTVPKRTASGVTNGVIAIAARPAVAVFRPIQVVETPRSANTTDRSGRPRLIEMPTALIVAIAAPIPR